jgi:hypothetical protein
MVLPYHGPISLDDIQNEFGGTNPQGLFEYYRGGSLGGNFVPNNITTSNIPAGSAGTTISLFDFYGAANSVTGNGIPATIYMTGTNSTRQPITTTSPNPTGATKTYYFGNGLGSGVIPWNSAMDVYDGCTWGFYALSAGGGGSRSVGTTDVNGTQYLMGGSGGGGGSCLMVTHGIPFDKNRQYKIEIGPPGNGGSINYAGGTGGPIIISSSSGVTGDDHVDNVIARVNGGVGGASYFYYPQPVNLPATVIAGGAGGTIPVQPVNSFIGIGGTGGAATYVTRPTTAAAFGGGGGGAGGFDATGLNQADGGDGGTNGGSGSQGNYGGAGGGASEATFSTYNGAYTWYAVYNGAFDAAGGYNSGGSSILPLLSGDGYASRRVIYDGTNPPYVDPYPPFGYSVNNAFWSQHSGVGYLGGQVTSFPMGANNSAPPTYSSSDAELKFENSAKYRHYQKNAANRNYPQNWFSKFFLTGQYGNNNLSPLTSGRDSRGAAGINVNNNAMGGGGVYGGFSGSDHRTYLNHATANTSGGRFNAFGVGGGAASNYFLSNSGTGNNIGSEQPGMPGGPGMVVIWFSTNSTGTGGFKKLPYNEGTPI